MSNSHKKVFSVHIQFYFLRILVIVFLKTQKSWGDMEKHQSQQQKRYETINYQLYKKV